MHPVDEFAALKAEIHRLETRAGVLRQRLLQNQGPLRSDRHEIHIREQFRRTLLPDRLPVAILDDPQYWETRVSAVLSVHRLLEDRFPHTRMRRVRSEGASPAPWQEDLPGLGPMGEGDSDVVLIE